MRQTGRIVLRNIADALYPPCCMACDQPVADAQMLCAPCWNDIDLIDGTTCDRCGTGMPLALKGRGIIHCDACLSGPLTWDRGRAAAIYGGSARSLVLGLKHGDKPNIAVALGRWMCRAAADIIAESDVIVPIPLHWRRLLARRYNQSAELARVMARETGLPHGPHLLSRPRPTEMQRARSASDRARNVRNAFTVPPRRIKDVAGRRILLVDDVLTTGATLNAATAALRASGAASVSTVVFARVPHAAEI